jgi:hypothetical protein
MRLARAFSVHVGCSLIGIIVPIVGARFIAPCASCVLVRGRNKLRLYIRFPERVVANGNRRDVVILGSEYTPTIPFQFLTVSP